MNTSYFSYNHLQKAVSGKWYNLNTSELISSNPAIKAISTDTRANNRETLFLALCGEKFDAHNFIKEAIESGASALCLEKGKFNINNIPATIPVLEVTNTLEAYQNIANFHRKHLKNLKLIAITGSNGKTSTKDILSGILSNVFGEKTVYTTKANTNNLIGVPQNILKITDQHKFAVIELGSNHPGEIEQLTKVAEPDIAVITSIGPAHLEFFKDINGVIKEKASIFSNFLIPEKAVAIMPSIYKYNELITKWINGINSLTFSNTNNADICWEHINTSINQTEFILNWKQTEEKHKVTWRIPGTHQISNAAAAAAAATALEIPPSTIAKSLPFSTVSGMRMRIKENNGITWVNDAYNANPASTKAGIDWLYGISSTENKNILLVLGDMLELGEQTYKVHSQIIGYAQAKLPNATIIGIGSAMNQAILSLNEETRNKPNILAYNTTDDAIPHIKSLLLPNSIIYLKGSRGIALEKIETSYIMQNIYRSEITF